MTNPNENLSTSQAIKDLIKNYEGNVILKASTLNGEAHPTVGWGHYNDPEIAPGTTITEIQAQAYFDADIIKFENFVKNTATIALTQNQFDALVMFAFNTGGKPNSKMWQAINNEDFEQAVYEWSEFRLSEGPQRIKPGTIARRNDEIQLFESGDVARDENYNDRVKLYKELVANGYSRQDAVELSNGMIRDSYGENCFPAGIQITMWDGSKKPIENIKVSDRVLSFDAHGNLHEGRVVRLYRNSTDHFIRLDIPGEEQPVHVTEGHNFLTASGDFKPIGSIIRDGKAEIVRDDGKIITVAAARVNYSSGTAHLFDLSQSAHVAGNLALKPIPEQRWQTYNFEVENYHTYIAQGVRVHNLSAAVISTGQDFQNNLLIELLEDWGILEEVESQLTIIRDDNKILAVLVNEDTQASVDGTTYVIKNVVNAVEAAADAVADFVSNLVDSGVAWFSNPNGAQLSFASWLATNMADLIEGNLDVDDAMISLAKHLGQDYLADFVSSSVTDVAGAKTVLTDVFAELGSEIPWAYADAVYTALGRMALDFVVSGFDAEQALKAGTATIAGAITTTYLTSQGWSNTQVGPAVAAITTAIQGLLNSGDFDSGDWAMLGVQVGIAAGSAAAGTAIASYILNVSVSTGNPVAIVAAAVVAFISSTIVSKIYWGKVFKEGEFGNPEQVLNSIYQVQDIVVNGQTVKALVAVHPQGSTIIAENISYILGNTGSDVLVGNDNAGTISAVAGADYLEARGGDDNLLGGDGNDHLNGGDGNDILQGDSGDDNVFGEAGADTIIGGAGNDFIHAGSADDVAAGGDGNDYILASGGNDAVSGDAGNDTLDGGYGNDSIIAGTGNDLVLGNLGNDAINGDEGNDTLFGSEGNDQIYGGDGNDFVDGGEGIDMLYGDVGNDLIVGGDGDDFADGGLGNDNVLGGNGNDVILGGMDADYLAGEAGDDSLTGGFGNDILIGGIGANALDGGDGNDVYIVSASTSDQNNIIVDVGSNGDTDTLLLTWLSQANALSSLTLLKDENDLVISHSGRMLATVTDQFAVAGNGIERIELSNGNFINLSSVTYHATSNLGSFSVAASNASSVAAMVAERETSINENLLSQNLFWNDTFLDKLSQLAYNEQLNDETVYRYYNGSEIESFKRARSKFGGHYKVYKLDVAGNMNGTEFVRLEYAILDVEDQSAAASFGNSEALMAGPYESFVNGATIVYSTFGGKSIQDIVVNGTVLSTRVAGESTLYTAGSIVYGATYAQRFAAGTKTTSDIAVKKLGSDLLVGGYWNEVIDGKSGDDALVGNNGNDTIIGGDGNDWGFGGDGADSLLGGNGDDVLFGDAGNDIIAGGANNDAIMGGGGNDTIAGDTGDDWIDGGDGTDYITGGDGNDVVLGNAGNDILFGNEGNDVIQGGDGNDSLDGGNGNDTLIGGNGQDTLNGGAGDDRVVFDSADGDVTFNFATGTYQIGVASSAQILSVEQITASSNDDTIHSGVGANYIDGGAGIDTVSYVHSTSGVTVNLATAQNSGGFAQGDVLRNIENVMGSNHGDYLIGNAQLSLYGNLFGRLIGSNTSYFKNALFGLAGNDTLIGGLGADFIDGGDGTDQVSYSNSATGVNVDLQNFLFSGGDAEGDYLTNVEHIIGTWQNDTVIGNAASNIIQTGGGNDFINGGNGNDTIAGAAGADTINGGQGIDLVTFFGSAAAVNANLTTSTFSGGDAAGDVITNVENLEGTAYNDTLIGDANNNQLSGGEGNDRLEGNGGHDVIYAWTGNDTVLAGAGNDFVLGDDGIDSVEGGAGLDTLFGGAGNDIIRGGDDNDFMIGDMGNDSLYGDAGQDSIFGYDGDDYIDGGVGNDVLAGEIGADTIFGADGDDIIYSDIVFSSVPVAFGNDSVDGGAGNDLIRTGGGNDTISGGIGNDSIYGDDGDDVITDLSGDNLINAGIGNDLITGGDGKDTILGYGGNDTIDGGINDDQLYGLLGNDSIIAGAGHDKVYGDSGDDLIQGNAGNDFLDGWTGNDTIDGGADSDTITGGDNHDSLSGGDGNDLIYGDRQLDANALPGSPSAILAMIDNKPAAYDTWGLLYQGPNYTLSQLQAASHDMLIINPAKLTVTGTPSSEVSWSDTEINSIQSTGKMVLGYVNTAKINSFWTQWDASWTSNGVANGALTAAGQAVSWLGDLDGGFIATREVKYWEANWQQIVFNRIDAMIHQDFNGTLLDDVSEFFERRLEGLTPNTQAYIDKISTNAIAMRDFVVAIRQRADVTMAAKLGIAVNQLTDATRFQLYVNGAPYMLHDALNNGNVPMDNIPSILSHPQSVKYLEAIDGIVVENFFARGSTEFINYTKALYGNDTHNIALLSLDTDQVTEQQRLKIISDAVNAGFMPFATENASYDTLNNTFLAELANATSGVAGNDTITGGLGNDTMVGGAGNDTYFVDSASDVVTENINEGTDIVNSSVTYTLGANVENLTLTGTAAINGTGNVLANILTGNSGANSLSGGDGADTIDGGVGNDTMIGGLGNDTFYVNATGDVVTENVTEGTDTVISSITYTLGANVENLTLTGAAFLNGTGNVLNNVIIGNSGTNTLNGNGGEDTLIGGAGGDTYFVDSAGDVVIENLNEGIDNVMASINYMLTANVDNVTLTGVSNINATGNVMNNYMTGNTGNNVIDGGAGNDTMLGGLGNDTYYVDSASDVVTENASEGTDTVNSTVIYTLGANVENLTLTGSASINGSGNALANNLIGNSVANSLSGGDGNDTINGGAGNDTMLGGLGNDTFYVNATGDVVTENASEGTDSVISSITYTLGVNVENLTLSGSAAINGTGNTLNNALTGNSGNNVLNGDTGNDTMAGGLGNDTYYVDVVGDVVTENASAGTDSIISSITYTLGANIENLTLAGTTALNGSGNALNNVLTGNSAINTLTGDDGNDTIYGGDGNDTLYGGIGSDLLVGGIGSDYMDGGDGIDTISYTGSTTFVSIDMASNNYWSGDASWDLIYNVENVIGSDYNDWIVGNSGANALAGGLGIDTLTGGLGNDTLDAGAGDDQLVGGDGDDLLIGGAGSDYIDGGAGLDTVSYVGSAAWVNIDLANNNQWNGDASWDNILNVENVIGSAYGDQITGSSIANVLNGGAGADTLYGLAGNDSIYGDEDGDIIIGGAGKDVLYGGTGADVFKILALSDSAVGNADTIMDFVQGVDKIDISGLGFTGIQNTATPTAGKLGTYVDSGWTHLTDGNGFDIAILGNHALTQADLINT